MRNVIFLISACASVLYGVNLTNNTGWVNNACTSTCDGTSEAHGWQTIDAARAALRGTSYLTSPSADLIVNINAGIYYLPSSVTFTSADAMPAGSPYHAIYQSYNGKVTISGGTLVSAGGWTQNGNIWHKSIPGMAYFRQLYINGVAATRARSQNTYTFTGWHNSGVANDGVTVDKVLFPTTKYDPLKTDIANIEIAWKAEWRSYRILVNAGVGTGGIGTSGTENYIGLNSSGISFVNNEWPKILNPSYLFFVENAFEELDNPGEWYFNATTSTLYYYPRVGEDLNGTGLNEPKIVASNLENLFNLSGSSAALVNNIRFSGLTFSHSGWAGPRRMIGAAQAGGVSFIQAEKVVNAVGDDPYNGGILIPGAVSLNYTTGVDISNNIFEHLGGSGIELANGNTSTTIAGNYFTDISAASIIVGRWEHEKTAILADVCQKININNNLIYDVAKEYFGSCAINVYTAQNSSIRHNLITKTSYTGISTGWRWDNSTVNHGIIDISFNYINNFNNGMRDGGGIYNLGNNGVNGTGNSNFSRNFIRRDNNIFNPSINDATWLGYSGGGLYLDQGSCFILGGFNVIENTLDPSPNQYRKRLQITASDEHDLSFSENFSLSNTETNQALAGATTVNFTEDASGNWQSHSGSWYTVSNAGLLPGYRWLLNYLPSSEQSSVLNQPYGITPITTLLAN